MKYIIALISIVTLLVGCNRSQEDKETIDESKQTPTPILTIEDALVSNEELIEDIIKDMTIEEKVAQLFVVDFFSFTKLDSLTGVTHELEEQMDTYPVGGFIFFAKNIVDTNQITTFIDLLQNKAKTPLWITVDEEGGLVSRLQHNENIGMTVTPSANVIGDTQDPINAYNSYHVIGQEMNALGFNMDFAPVADINTNPENPVIGERAFSADAKVVGNMVIESVRGLEEQNIAAVIKHFPGHGDTSMDTHTGSVYVEHDINRLNEIELVPFKMAIEQGVSCIMVAHISLPNVTKTDEPATLSKKIITDILRENMGFDGVVITDAMNMGAVADNYESDVACVKAIQAGVDILLMPEDFELGFKGVLDAVENGDISIERINQSVEKILTLKFNHKLFDEHREKESLEVIGSKENKDLVNEIIK